MNTSALKKANVEKLFKKLIEKSEDITIEKSYKARCKIISELTTILTKDYQQFFEVNNHNLEGKIASYKQSFRNKKNRDLYYYSRYDSQTENDYIEEQLHSNLLDTYFLEKYKSTPKIANEVLLCDLHLSWMALSKIMFAIFFNDSSQLCFDFIVTKGNPNFGIKSIEDEIKTISTTTTSVEAIKKLLGSLVEEAAKIEEENKIRRQLNEKNKLKKDKIKALSTKAVISKIKSILDDKGFSYKIDERYYIFEISLQMKKGETIIKVPKKDIKTRFDILPSLCEKIIEADKLNIHCRYYQ